MKKNIFKTIGSGITTKIAIIAAAAVIFVACEKEEKYFLDLKKLVILQLERKQRSLK